MASKKDDIYFDMFVTSVNYACQAADSLLDLVQDYTNIEQKVEAIHDLEHAADEHFHLLFKHLSKAFITPIEREDILLLAQSIDSITDSIENVADRFYMLNVTHLPDDVQPFTRLIVKSCVELKTAMTEFQKFKKSKNLFAKILEVNNVEEEGDRFYKQAVRRLFEDPVDIAEAMKWRELYAAFEECLDACEDVADTIEGIVLKNS